MPFLGTYSRKRKYVGPERISFGLTLLSLSLGCAGTPQGVIATPRSACVVGASGTAPAESISVATPAPVNPAHAPAPANTAERFVFAQIYETLIAVDCDGRAYPGLAQSWITDATKTRVTLTLRDGARFSSGEPVNSRDVVAAWRATGAASADLGQLARRLADATTIVDDRTLTVSLPDTERLILAEPALAVFRPPMIGTVWPVGSGPYRATEAAADVAPGRLALVPQAPRTGARLAIRSALDARDAVDAGVDLLLTADVVAVTYAVTQPALATVAPPWQRTYALAIPSRAPTAVTDALSPASDSAAAFRASLARDAVRAEARAADSHDWWTGIQGCESLPPPTTSPAAPGSTRRIVYRSDDHVARELAARLVAVGRRATATPLPPADFDRALRAGGEFAYVVGIPRSSLAPCHDLAGLLSRAPWLGTGGTVADALVPLIDTRERAVMRRDRVSATLDWDGTLRMSGTASRP